jgi:serine/threonine-protein kinase RsbW
MTAPAAMLNLRIPNRVADLTAVLDTVNAFLQEGRVDPDDCAQVMIIVDEIASNIIKSAWPGGGEHVFDLALRLEPRGSLLELATVDDGVAFDPTTAAQPDLDAALEEREVGSLGLFMVVQMSDSMVYARVEERNHLTVTKVLKRRE